MKEQKKPQANSAKKTVRFSDEITIYYLEDTNNSLKSAEEFVKLITSSSYRKAINLMVNNYTEIADQFLSLIQEKTLSDSFITNLRTLCSTPLISDDYLKASCHYILAMCYQYNQSCKNKETAIELYKTAESLNFNSDNLIVRLTELKSEYQTEQKKYPDNDIINNFYQTSLTKLNQILEELNAKTSLQKRTSSQAFLPSISKTDSSNTYLS